MEFNKNFVFNTNADFNAIVFNDGSGNGLISLHEDHTWEMWVKGPVATEGIVYNEGASASSFRGQYRLMADGAGKVRLYYRDWDADLLDVTSATAVFDDNWHHIAVVEDTTTGTTAVTLYVDGVADATISGTTYARPTSWNNSSGSGGRANRSVFGAIARADDMDKNNMTGFTNANLAYNGEIDEFASWKKALSAVEVGVRADNATGRCTAPSGADLFRYVSFDATPIADNPGSASIILYDGANYDGTDGENLRTTDYTNFTFNDYNGCSVASVADDILSKAVSIYPNPTNSMLNIKINDTNINIKNINLIDITGKVVYSNSDVKPFNVSQYSKGLYVLKIESQQGNVATRKVVVN